MEWLTCIGLIIAIELIKIRRNAETEAFRKQKDRANQNRR